MALNEEMNDHLGYLPNERHIEPDFEEEDSANTRNGYSTKVLKTSREEFQIKIPRD